MVTEATAQDQSLGGNDPTSTLNYYEVIDSRINFYAVDDQYNVIPNIIYYIERQGFIVNLGWDSIQVGSDWYIILTYPPYNGATGAGSAATPGQNAQPYFHFVNAMKGLRVKGLQPDTTDGKKPAKQAVVPANVTVTIDGQSTVLDAGSGDQPIALNDFKPSSTTGWTRTPLAGTSGLRLLINKSDFDKLRKRPLYSTAFKLSRMAFASGQLTVPFKLRGARAGRNFSMTTDVTLGAYAGLKMRVSKRQDFFLTFPVVVGLTFIDVNNNTTSATQTSGSGSTGTTSTATTQSVYPGWTISTGVIAQLNKFNIGIVTGWDYASGVGSTWIYQGKNWVSFGLGYSFLK